MVTKIAEMRRRMNCLMNQVVQSTHCWSPIINIDSLIRVSFSSTSSYHNTVCHMYENRQTYAIMLFGPTGAIDIVS